MENDHRQNSQQFRYSVVSGKQADIAQTVDHQKAKYGPGEYFPQILYILRRWLSCREQEKGQISGKSSSQNYHSYGNDLLR